ncbi:MAG: PTS fructose transporter subunit IIB [Acholeplasmataceae bacterium]|nr:PTS fructose transporter subunit IIB [Acholeplasmataceae bacterium]
MLKIVAVTACPTGIAHTYMAAEVLESEGRKLGVEVIVETNGSIGVENRLKEKDIKESIAVIIAADIRVEKARFQGKPLKEATITFGIHHAKELILGAIEGRFEIYDHRD